MLYRKLLSIEKFIDFSDFECLQTIYPFIEILFYSFIYENPIILTKYYYNEN